MSDYAKQCFMSTKADGYNKKHRLVAGRRYKIALVPGKEITRDFDRTTVALRMLGEKYGYAKPLGGHIPRIREVISDKQMEEMGIRYITSLHDPIENSKGMPCVLVMSRSDHPGGVRWISIHWFYSDSQLDDFWAIAFPVSAS